MNKERTILYLFSINAIIYIASGFYTPFLSAYYAQKGIDAEKIGILLMIGPCVVLLTQRFWAKMSIPIKMSTFFGNSEHPFPEK